ncbi:Cys-tRNA(Pro) deacylase [Floccifex sp.]|uniref:Cys-tRNA(Pro) deacylase n=1 Tax=Floccifex sp. TaxID=2815810 RepID=UPI00387E9231
MIKTNAMRILDQNNISYTTHEYPHGKEAVDGVQVADLLHEPYEMVYKTLVTQANTKEFFVFMIPVDKELDLKKCAKVANVKSIEMIHVKDITKITGYVRGGCSPLAMKKSFKTFVYEECVLYDSIIFSGGKIGIQIEMSPMELIDLLKIECVDCIKA